MIESEKIYVPSGTTGKVCQDQGLEKRKSTCPPQTASYSLCDWTFVAPRTTFGSYEEVDQEIGKLLREFWLKINSYHPENHFCYLRTDGLWNLQDGNKIMSGMEAIRKRELLDLGIQGGFPEELQKTFEEHLEWALEIEKDLLTSHFPESLHEDILMTVGIDQVLPNRITEHRNESRRRDPFFRQEVL